MEGRSKGSRAWDGEDRNDLISTVRSRRERVVSELGQYVPWKDGGRPLRRGGLPIRTWPVEDGFVGPDEIAVATVH